MGWQLVGPPCCLLPAMAMAVDSFHNFSRKATGSAAAAAAAAARGMEFVGGGEPGAGAEEEGGLLGGEGLGLEVLPGAELVPNANPEEVSLGSFEREEAEEAAEAAVAEARAALAALPALRARPVPAGVVPGFGAFVWDAVGAVQVRPKRRCRGGRLPPRPAPLEGGSSRRRAALASSRAAPRGRRSGPFPRRSCPRRPGRCCSPGSSRSAS